MQLGPAADPDDGVLFPTPREAIAAAVASSRVEPIGSVWICRGAQVGCTVPHDGCADCYEIAAHDRRSIDQHVRAFLEGDA